MLQIMTKHFFLQYISKIINLKFSFNLQKNVRVILASKETNFTDFYGKLFKNLYDYNFNRCLHMKPLFKHK